MLVNPTGKPGKFQGVDWVIELHNLYMKVEHGGSGSNQTVQHIIKESPLVWTYQDAHITIEKNFSLTHLTRAHRDPNMAKTLEKFSKI
ncbi:hypothetical protein L208DRAFT_1265008 [Tricholoma matsutake]|nr:hypothetical protein L208DRAFT_1265008 [Tricholoma matsutake 945]